MAAYQLLRRPLAAVTLYAPPPKVSGHELDAVPFVDRPLELAAQRRWMCLNIDHRGRHTITAF
jgi:hypothetical protein